MDQAEPSSCCRDAEVNHQKANDRELSGRCVSLPKKGRTRVGGFRNLTLR